MNILTKNVATGLALGFLTLSSSAFGAEKANPQMQEVLDKLQSLNGKPIETLSAAEARMQPTPTDAVIALMAAKGIKADKTTVVTSDVMIDGAAGKIPARIYRPAGAATNMPLIVYYHGGGFVIATNDTYDASPRALSEQVGAVILSVEYRKAPENKFPAAHDDAFAAYTWALKNAQSLGIDPTHIAVAGESAGGNLALNVAIKARDQGVRLPDHELLVYPIAGNDMNTESYKINADAKPLSKAMMGWFIKQYTANPNDATDPRLNLLAADLHGLNPATVITAEIDPLRSEGKSLADKLKKAGVKVNYMNYEGVTHEFFGMAPVLDEAKAAEKVASDDLKSAFMTRAVTGR